MAVTTPVAIKIGVNITATPFYYLKRFSAIPPNPQKASETIEAAIKVMGVPSNALGGLLEASLSRTPEKTTIARRKPRPEAYA